MKRVIFYLFCFLTFAVHAQKNYVFIGSYNQDKNEEGIFVYQLDTSSGVLTKVSSVKGFKNPSFITLSPDGNFLYACTDTRTPNAGSVSSFRFDKEKDSLYFINSQISGGENPVFLTVHKSGKWLVNANYTEASVSVYPLSEEGKIAAPVQIIHYQDSSVNKERQDKAHIHSVFFSPKYDFVFFPDLGADKIRTYQFEESRKEPLLESNLPFVMTDLGAGPRHMAFHPNVKYAYCIEELSGTIVFYRYKNGCLKKKQRLNAHSGKNKSNFGSADIHISPDGKFLYASNRGEENDIAIFEILKNGTLKTIGFQSTLGVQPRNFAIDPSGKFLIVANQASGNVVVFKRNQTTGILEKVGVEIKIPSPSCVRIM